MEATSICWGAVSTGKVGMEMSVVSASALVAIVLRQQFSGEDWTSFEGVARHMLMVVGGVV